MDRCLNRNAEIEPLMIRRAAAAFAFAVLSAASLAPGDHASPSSPAPRVYAPNYEGGVLFCLRDTLDGPARLLSNEDRRILIRTPVGSERRVYDTKWKMNVLYASYHGYWRYDAGDQKVGHSIILASGERVRTIDWLRSQHDKGVQKVFLISCRTGDWLFAEMDLQTGGTTPWPDWVVRETRPGRVVNLAYLGYLEWAEDLRGRRAGIDDLRVLRDLSQADGNQLLRVNFAY